MHSRKNQKFVILYIIIIISCSACIVTLFIRGNTRAEPLGENGFIQPQNPIEKIIDVPTVSQFPELPACCEAVAATMVLQYYGEGVTPKQFAENWLEYSDKFYSSGNKKYGPNPNLVFVGNPFSKTAYGCYADPVINAINKNSAQCEAAIVKSASLEKICRKYIDANIPVLVWATTSMKPSGKGSSWYLSDNSEFTWISGEHCMVLVGYNEKFYYFNDPQSGSIVAYQKYVAEKRFEELGSRVVCIVKKQIT